jgi:hypothetical protein
MVNVPDEENTCMVENPPAAGAELVQVVPLLVKTLPEVLGATNVGADPPLPKRTLFAVSVDRLVPPLPTGNVPVTSEALTTPSANNAPVDTVDANVLALLICYSGCIGHVIVQGKPS